MLLIRVARMTTIWTKAEHRDPKQREPIFRAGDRMPSAACFADGILTLPEAARPTAADLLVVEEDRAAGVRLHPFQFQPRAVERQWSLFGLRLGEGDAVELWLRDGRGLFYGAPRRAEYRLALLRPGDVTRVLHNAKNDFAAASGRERTYRWSDFVFEALGPVAEIRCREQSFERVLPLDGAKTVDLREDLL